MKLAIIDLDGVIADNTARFAKAEEAKAEFAAHTYATADLDGSKRLHQAALDVYWKTAFDPSLVPLDTLIDGLPEALNQVSHHGYDVLYLTSRPETMRDATVVWMKAHGLTIVPRNNAFGILFPALLMKPASQQFVKTLTWKTGIVETLIRLFDVEDLLFVDDEPAICESVAQLPLPCPCVVHVSLQAALADIQPREEQQG